MKTRVITTLCVVFVLGLVTSGSAQLIANSPEDKAFTKIEHENNLEAKIVLLLDFERQFPKSKALSDVYRMLSEAYQEKNDAAKIIEIGERAIKFNPEDVDALLKVSRNLGMRKQELDKAVTYAQRAVDRIHKMKDESAPPEFSDEAQWKKHLASLEQYAEGVLNYVKRLK